jgi:hypothetical protein
MFRVLVVLFWISLLIGTLLAHYIVANWALTLAGLYFLARWWTLRNQASRQSSAARPAVASTSPRGTDQLAIAESAPPNRAASRWTVDRVHVAERAWR